MGFSVAGAAVVVGFALIAATTGLAATWADRAHGLEAAEREALERLGRQARTRMDITEVKLIGIVVLTERLYVIADNTGSDAINVSRMDVLLDGAERSDLIMNWTAGSKAQAGVWSPATRLYLRLDTTTIPDRAVLVSDTGVTDTWDG